VPSYRRDQVPTLPLRLPCKGEEAHVLRVRR